MKIALVGYEANIKNRVGSNQYAFELIKEIYQLDKKNQYIVYLPSPPLADLPKERENWHYQVLGPGRLWNVFGLPRGLFQQKPDLVFNPGHYSPLLAFAPLVVAIMDLGYLRFPEQFTKPIYWKLKFWTGWSIKRAKHLLAISESTKNDIIKNYGLDSSKITVTYPGYDQTRFKPGIKREKIERVKKKYRVKGDYLLFLSTLKPNKNLEGLLEAFKLLDKKDLSLVIAGRKGWLFNTIFAKVNELNLGKQVIFTDFVPEEEVPALIKGAQVFVMPSFWEGFGIPVVEAMACGTPVLVSNQGSLPEIVGQAGVIVDPYQPKEMAQGMEKALKEKDDLIKKGLVQAKQFSWQACAQKTIKVLEGIK
ncbi:MAG TPA: glycosyltransferase family 1 protein [Patescibacteria group bacterium]|nr:glycosyltransferase family 1 protein [Patescibacteria group bacterium]